MAAYRQGDVTVTYEDSPEIHRAVFNRLLEWFHEHGAYNGESIMQSDAPQLTAAEMLAEIADDVIGFKAKYDDDL